MTGFAIDYWPGTTGVKSFRAVDSADGCLFGEDFWPFEDGAPPLPVPSPLTAADILSAASERLQFLTTECVAQKAALTNRLSTLLDAIDLEMATSEETAEKTVRSAQLLAWKKYGVELGRVPAQAAWPTSVAWPVQPAEGMDMTVSAVAPASGR